MKNSKISMRALFTFPVNFWSAAKPHLPIDCSSEIAGAIPSSRSSPSEASRLTKILPAKGNMAPMSLWCWGVLFFSFASSISSLAAEQSGTSCCFPAASPCYEGSSWCRGWYLGGRALVWKPMLSDLDVVSRVEYRNKDENLVPSGCISRRYMEPVWNTGFQVLLGKSRFLCNWDLQGSYSYFQTSDRRCFNADENPCCGTVSLLDTDLVGLSLQFEGESVPELAAPNYLFVSSSLKLHYQSADLLFSRSVCCNSCHIFRPFFGVAGARVDQSLDGSFCGYLLNSNLSSECKSMNPALSWRSRYQGIGLKMGSGYDYRCSNCLTLKSSISGSLLAGDVESCNRQKINRRYAEGQLCQSYSKICYPLCYQDRRSWVLVPGAQFDIGFDYSACIFGANLSVFVGYECLVWFNLPKINRFTWDSSECEFVGENSQYRRLNSRSCNEITGATIGFQGLKCGLSLGY